MTAPPEFPRTYRASSGTPPWLFFAGGIGLVLVAVFGFFTSLYGRGGIVSLHMTSTLPMILAVALFSTGYRLARAPREVTVSDEGLRIGSRAGDRLLSWDQIAWADVQSQAYTGRGILTVYGTDGKALVKLPSNLDQFDTFVESVKQRLTERPSPHASAVRWRKSRRQGIGLLVGAVLALAGAGFMAWVAYDAKHSAELMQSRGVEGEGVVVRKFVAPDGVTHRIEFRVAGAGDDAKLHNVEIDRRLWDNMQTGVRLPIRTVPGHPEIAKLLHGEIKDDMTTDSVGLNVLLSIALLLMCVAFLVGAILGFKGIDIKTDPLTKKLKVERLPEVSHVSKKEAGFDEPKARTIRSADLPA